MRRRSIRDSLHAGHAPQISSSLATLRAAISPWHLQSTCETRQPAALILLSPWADFEHKDGTSRTENFTKDKVLGEGTPFAPHLCKTPPYAGSLPLDDPRLSPIHADLSELPPMLIQTGGYDLLLTEDEQLAEKAKADGTSVTFTVYPEMPHVFPLALPELAESIAAYEEVRDFVTRYMQT